MAININKGSPLGKYYYSKDNNVFGPIPLEELLKIIDGDTYVYYDCLLYTSPSPRDRQKSRMPSSA